MLNGAMEFCFKDAVKMADYKEMICCFSVSIRFVHSSYRTSKIVPKIVLV